LVCGGGGWWRLGGFGVDFSLESLSEICAARKGMVFEPSMSHKGIDFGHINVTGFSLWLDTACLV